MTGHPVPGRPVPGGQAQGSLLRLRRPALRTQLALLYAGVFIAMGVVLLGVSGLLIGRSSAPALGTTGGQAGPNGSQLDIGPALAFAGMVVVAFGLGWLIAGRVLRPLRTITATARDISARNLHQRLALDGPDDEFRQLGATLNGLFGRLEASFEAQRHFVANASHELRTPLAAERTLLQVALADSGASAESLRATCKQLLALGGQQERLIDALLTLASSERGADRWEPFDLAELAGKAILDRQAEAGQRTIRIDAALGAAPATGDPSMAASLVANLVDNAVRHNLNGGRVEISTAITDGLAVLSVSNTGTVIPAGETDRLFQPFQRLGTERIRQASGHGLGLAIVRAIAQVHGATLAARPRPGGGLEIQVTFP